MFIKKWVRRFRYYLIRLFRLNRGRHQIAIGFSMGFFPCWFPTFGVGPTLSIILVKVVKGNIPAAVIAAALGSIAWPILFFLNYKIGHLIRGLPELFSSSNITEVMEDAVEDPEYVETAIELSEFGDVGLDFLVGSIVNSLFFTALIYIMFRFVLKYYRTAILTVLRSRKKD